MAQPIFKNAFQLTSINGVLEAQLVLNSLPSLTLDDGSATGFTLLSNLTTQGQGNFIPTAQGIFAYTYNGQPYIPGPTLITNPGDRLRLSIVNNLPETIPNVNEQAMDSLTNFHTHGLRVSPLGFGDNIVTHWAPGETRNVEIDIPQNHPIGFNWYHPHPHEITSSQASGGLAGGLEIGDIASRYQLPVQDIPKQIMNLQGFYYQTNSNNQNVIVNPFYGGNNDLPVQVAINGQINPIIPMRTGKTGLQLWDLLNISSDSWLQVGLFRESDVKANNFSNPIPLGVIAVDGDGGNEDPRPVNWLFMNPARRFSVFAQIADPGDYVLYNLNPGDTQNGGVGGTGDVFTPNRVLATVQVTGESSPVTSFPPLKSNLSNTITSTDALYTITPDRTRTIEFNMGGKNPFVINGTVYDDIPLAIVPLNTVEEWTLINASGTWDPGTQTFKPGDPVPDSLRSDPDFHPFHIHQGDFLVTKINGLDTRQMTNDYGVYNGFFMDTVPMPGTHVKGSVTLDRPYGNLQSKIQIDDNNRFVQYNDVEPGVITIRQEFRDFTGTYVYHCHILDHEDLGMMASVRVVLNPRDIWLGLPNPDNKAALSLYQAADTEVRRQLQPFGKNYTQGFDSYAIADVNHDNVTDIIVPKAGTSRPTVRVFDGVTLKPIAQLRPFQERADILKLETAAGDINGDGYADIVIARGSQTRQAQVKILSGKDLQPLIKPFDPVKDSGFMNQSFRGGIRVATGDLDGDNFDDLIVAEGPGANAEVQAYSGIDLVQGKSLKQSAIFIDSSGRSNPLHPFGSKYKGGINISSGYLLKGYQASNDYGKVVSGAQTRLANLIVSKDVPKNAEVQIWTAADPHEAGHSQDHTMHDHNMHDHGAMQNTRFKVRGGAEQLLGSFSDILVNPSADLISSPQVVTDGVLVTSQADGKRANLINLTLGDSAATADTPNFNRSVFAPSSTLSTDPRELQTSSLLTTPSLTDSTSF